MSNKGTGQYTSTFVHSSPVIREDEELVLSPNRNTSPTWNKRIVPVISAELADTSDEDEEVKGSRSAAETVTSTSNTRPTNTRVKSQVSMPALMYDQQRHSPPMGKRDGSMGQRTYPLSSSVSMECMQPHSISSFSSDGMMHTHGDKDKDSNRSSGNPSPTKTFPTSSSEGKLSDMNVRGSGRFANRNMGMIRTPTLELKKLTDEDKKKSEKQLHDTLTAIKQDIHMQRLSGDKKVVVFMCGLPARGKSFISKKLARYLRWMGYGTEVFNVGNLRRKRKQKEAHSANFFDPNNQNAKDERDRLALDVLDHAIDWLQNENGQVAIHDATNSNVQRRRTVYDVAKTNGNVQVIFIESICNDPLILQNNINLKLQSPDYKDMDPVRARSDFMNRLKNYESAYETLTDTEGDYAYIKVINVGGKIVARNISSFLPGLMCTFLMNMHLQQRPIWLTRHGESVYNMQYRVGGDTKLSPLGRQYGRAFSVFIQEQLGNSQPESPPRSPMLNRRMSPSLETPPSFLDLHARLEEEQSDEPDEPDENGHPSGRRNRSLTLASDEAPPIMAFTPCTSPKRNEVVVWTSGLQRAVETSSYLPPGYNFHQTAMLNEIFAGRCEGMTYGQIMNQLPMEFLARARDKLRYRYPNSGESYIDVVERVRPLVTELERTVAPIIIVGHMASLRAIYAYFMNVPLKQVPYLNFPLHTAVCLSELPFGMKEDVYQWSPKNDGTSVWEYLPNYSVTSDTSDGHILQSVASLGEEYETIDEAEFQKYREKAIADQNHERLEGEEYFNQMVNFLSFDRNTKRTCKWDNCDRQFANHPAFVAHVISDHCSSGGSASKAQEELHAQPQTRPRTQDPEELGPPQNSLRGPDTDVHGSTIATATHLHGAVDSLKSTGGLPQTHTLNMVWEDDLLAPDLPRTAHTQHTSLRTPMHPDSQSHTHIHAHAHSTKPMPVSTPTGISPVVARAISPKPRSHSSTLQRSSSGLGTKVVAPNSHQAQPRTNMPEVSPIHPHTEREPQTHGRAGSNTSTGTRGSAESESAEVRTDISLHLAEGTPESSSERTSCRRTLSGTVQSLRSQQHRTPRVRTSLPQQPVTDPPTYSYRGESFDCDESDCDSGGERERANK